MTVQGFGEDMVLEKLHIVSEVTSVDLDEGTFILGINEAIHVPSNTIALFITFQVRKNGGIVNDVCKRHG